MPTPPHHSQSAALRKKLGHPVVDADGHWLEFGPSISDYLRQVGGSGAPDAMRAMGGRVVSALQMTLAERRDKRRAQEAFWAVPTNNTLDRATAMLPKLLYQRLDEFGFDFTVLYPSVGLRIPFIPEDEARRVSCRAFNLFQTDQFREFKDRMTPAAVIPMHTPQEAIEELEYAVKQLGLKVAMMASMIRRPIVDALRKTPELARYAHWFDMLGLDSEHDYDPVWAKCVELGVSPSFHSGSRGVGLRVSPANFVYNHIGHFGAASEAVCKALFLGGVTRRFPRLKFAFLEGGVGWACNLYSDLVGHWKKRNRHALEEVNPKNLDRAMLLDLVRQHAGEQIAARLRSSPIMSDFEGAEATGGIPDLDDFSACKIERAEQIRELFDNFYFGCEADDPINAWAFNRKVNPYGARLNVLLGSDIGHFDVTDMSAVLEEAYELVEHGLIDEQEFRDFVFANPVRFWGEANPRFFDGTAVEREARALLSAK